MTATVYPLVETRLSALASTINQAQREIEFAGKTMLSFAKMAGEALIAAKKECAHGEFKAWVEANCRCSYQTASVYMKVAREWDQKSSVLDFSTTSIRDFINNKPKPKPAAPTLDRNDATHALKLSALAERGVGGEQEVAREKLAAFAKGFGMTSEEVVEKAHKLCPEEHLSAAEVERQGTKREILAPFVSMKRTELLEVIFELIIKLSRKG